MRYNEEWFKYIHTQGTDAPQKCIAPGVSELAVVTQHSAWMRFQWMNVAQQITQQVQDTVQFTPTRQLCNLAVVLSLWLHCTHFKSCDMTRAYYIPGS